MRKNINELFTKLLDEKQSNNAALEIKKYGIHLKVHDYGGFKEHVNKIDLLHTKLLFDGMELTTQRSYPLYQSTNQFCYCKYDPTEKDRINIISDSLKIIYQGQAAQNPKIAQIFDEEISLIDGINKTQNAYNIDPKLLSSIISNLEKAIRETKDQKTCEIYKEKLNLYKKIEPMVKDHVDNGNKSNKQTLVVVGCLAVLVVACAVGGYVIYRGKNSKSTKI